MDSCFKSTVVQQLFGRLGTHGFLDCAVLIQFAFSKGEFYGSIFRSACAIVLFRNPSDRQMVTNLNTKLFPKKSHKKKSDQFLQKALRRAVEIMGVHGYIVINCDPQNPLSEKFQLSTNVLADSKGKISPIYFKNPD